MAYIKPVYFDNKVARPARGIEIMLRMYKAHIGVDAGTGYIHTVTATAANVHDVSEAHKLIREDDEVIYGDAG